MTKSEHILKYGELDVSDLWLPQQRRIQAEILRESGLKTMLYENSVSLKVFIITEYEYYQIVRED